MRRIIISLIISLTVALNICIISNALAFEENAFTGGDCVTDDNWTSSATTEYKLNNETGVYELSGQTYNDYKASNTNNLYVFYSISSDGKILYGYVPNYATVVANGTSRDTINNKGVITTANCAGTLRVSKTVIGNPPTSESTTPSNSTQTTENNATENSNVSNPSSLDDVSGTETLESPNTASTTAKIAIVASIALVAVAAYVIMIKVKPELFGKK